MLYHHLSGENRPAASSITWPNANSVSSSNGRPMSWSPSGNPSAESPPGTEIPGSPARFTVTVNRAEDAKVTIEFGGANPLGLERYARIAGRTEILLMPAFVADAWDPVVEAR